MTDTLGTPIPSSDAAEVTGWMSELGVLLEELEQVSGAPESSSPAVSHHIDSQLVQVRLGTASALYTAMRAKNAATASHALRVALTSSAWARAMDLPNELRDAIELAALLHDVGNIGVPDKILLKPGPLDREELEIMEGSRVQSLEILRSTCADPAVLEIVENVGAWFDGFKKGFRLVGDQIPLGARMITIVEAFDAMTTDHVYRTAMSQERANRELFEYASSQFDPALVKSFVELHTGDMAKLRGEAAAHWLHDLAPDAANTHWQLSSSPAGNTPASNADLFQAKLLDNMHDAVVFVDAALRVILWNHGAERLTGVVESTVLERQWQPSLLSIRNEKGEPLHVEDCPVTCAINSGVQSLRRLTICGRNGRPISVDSHTIPVVSDEGVNLGAVVILHDASPETSLEERCQSLHEKATKDPLTQVANRAEFDRVHDTFVKHHKQQQVPCSLMICDLDRFKQVNDTYGHQAGDDAIKSLATLLKNSCRAGDLVARYGGEEFVMLFADCDNASATRRAENIRKALSQMSQPKLDGRPVTASFGVTEIQPGDTAETMLRRADRALLQAKSRGRNVVVQLGIGSVAEEEEPKRRFWQRKAAKPESVVSRNLTTPAPIKMVIEKLRGFVADHQAKIISIEGNTVQLDIDDRSVPMRRQSDRLVAFRVELQFTEETYEQPKPDGETTRTISRTRIGVMVSPRKSRDRRRDDVSARATEVLLSFQSYLMASPEEAPPQGVLRRAQSILAPWMTKH